MNYFDGIWYFRTGSGYQLVKAGFIEDKQSDIYYTTDWKIAKKYYNYATETAKQAIDEFKKASLEASKKSDSNIIIPAPDGLQYLNYQKAGIEYASTRKYTLIADQPGCVDGDAIVTVCRAGGSRKMKLSKLVHSFNGGISRGSKKWDLTIPTNIRCLYKGEFRSMPITWAGYKGEKKCLLITLADGKSIKVTYDHEVLTTKGYIEAQYLTTDSEVITNGVAACKRCGSKKDIITYKHAKFIGWCKTCAHRHGAQRRFIKTLPKQSKIVSIKQAGKIKVYDITVPKADNFVANGIVVHNCGKTIQAIGLVNLKKLKSVLVICPASLKENWRREFNKWKTQNISVGVCDGKSFPDTDVVIINYEQVKKFRTYLHAKEWDLLCCDESHYLKSPDAQRTNEVLGGGKHRIKPIPHKRAIFLTGTPLMNRPEELWTTVKFMKLFKSSDWHDFHIRYCAAKRTPFGWDTSGASNLGELNELLRSTVMVRRLKDDVLSELPKKSRRLVTLDIEAGELEKAVSERAAKKGFDLSGLDDSQLEILFESVAKERVILGNSKVEPAFKYLMELIQGGVESIVVFAEHKKVLDSLQERFLAKGITCSRIDGDVKPSLRSAEVDKFQSGENKIFLGTIKAAGVGITLTKSSYVVFVEPTWTPSDLVQAEDRCFVAGTPVLTPTGWVPIEHLKIGDLVITHKGVKPILDAWSKGCTENLVTVDIDGFEKPITCTSTHKWALEDGSWIEAHNLKPCMRLLKPKITGYNIPYLDFPEDCKVDETFTGSLGFQRNGRLCKAPDKVHLTSETLFVLGYFIGDGFASVGGGKGSFISFSGNITKKKTAIQTIENWLKVQGVNYTTHIKGNGTETRAYSMEWAKWFKMQFSKNGLVGAENKKIPLWMFDLSETQKLAVLDGLECSDGYKRSGRMEYTSCSKDLIAQVGLLAMSVGYKPLMGVNSGAEMVAYSYNTKGVGHRVKSVLQTSSSKVNGRRLPVYDITVADDNTFVVGWNVVHNCHRIGQQNAVQVEYIVAKDTIDEAIMAKVIKKAEIIQSALDNDGDIIDELEPEETDSNFLEQRKSSELHKSQWENFLKGARVKAIIEVAGKTHELIKSYGKWYMDGKQISYLPNIDRLWHEGRCSACGRRLTDPESIERGLGPVCSGIKL